VFQEPESKIAAMIVVFALADLPVAAASAIHYSESGPDPMSLVVSHLE
jgi:hypothetical protein